MQKFVIERYGIAALLVGLCMGMLVAQPRVDNHRLAVWGVGGGSFLLENADNVASKGRLGGGLGIGYEWNRERFLLQTGVDFSCLGSNWQVEPFVHEVPMVDSEGDAFTGRFHFNENRDINTLGYLNIPLLVGGQFGRFYFLAGGKAGLNLFGTSRVENVVNATAVYDEFIGEFEDMPNHGLSEQLAEADYAVQMGVNVAVSAELGWTWLPAPEKKSQWIYRLGFVVDYGVLNVLPGGASEEMVLALSDAPYRPVLNSLARTSQFAGSAVHPFFVGVKFTALFNFKHRWDCHCEWF